MKSFSFLSFLKRKKLMIDFDRDIQRVSIQRKMNAIFELQNKINYYNNLCIEECSFENRKNAFQNVNKVQDFLNDDVISCIIDFAGRTGDAHECLKNHQDLVEDLENRIEYEAGAIRRIHEDYENSVAEYLENVYYFILEFGERNLDKEYQSVQQTL